MQESVKARVGDLLAELVHVKKERGFDVLFFAIVDIVRMRSDMLLVGPREQALAEATFGCSHANCMMDMGNRVSRKLTLVPPLTKTLTAATVDVKAIPEPAVDEMTELVMHEHSNGVLVRVATAT